MHIRLQKSICYWGLYSINYILNRKKYKTQSEFPPSEHVYHSLSFQNPKDGINSHFYFIYLFFKQTSYE